MWTMAAAELPHAIWPYTHINWIAGLLFSTAVFSGLPLPIFFYFFFLSKSRSWCNKSHNLFVYLYPEKKKIILVQQLFGGCCWLSESAGANKCYLGNLLIFFFICYGSTCGRDSTPRPFMWWVPDMIFFSKALDSGSYNNKGIQAAEENCDLMT